MDARLDPRYDLLIQRSLARVGKRNDTGLGLDEDYNASLKRIWKTLEKVRKALADLDVTGLMYIVRPRVKVVGDFTSGKWYRFVEPPFYAIYLNCAIKVEIRVN